MSGYKSAKLIFDKPVWSPGTTIATSSLQSGEVMVKMERFAFTANNLTYAVTGDQIGYWQFFPPHDTEANGSHTSWGFARVVESNHMTFPLESACMVISRQQNIL